MPREVDYYDLLGVARDATDVEIRERFRGLAREAHPDRAPAERRVEAESKFQELAEAVNVLASGGVTSWFSSEALPKISTRNCKAAPVRLPKMPASKSIA